MSAGSLLTLAPGEVHVWRTDLDTLSAGEFTATLGEDERARAAAFVFATDRDRFTIARGARRAILARYLGVEPARVVFARTAAGRPVLVRPPASAPLRFSTSHSAGVALYALTAGRDVGVDIERVRTGLVDDVLAGHILSPGEIANLEALPGATRADAFFRIWTRKEAYVKARGLGLALSLQRFTVSVDSGRPALLDAEDDDPARWTLIDLDAGPGYAAALVVEGGIDRLQRWSWPEGAVSAERSPGGSPRPGSPG